MILILFSFSRPLNLVFQGGHLPRPFRPRGNFQAQMPCLDPAAEGQRAAAKCSHYANPGRLEKMEKRAGGVNQPRSGYQRGLTGPAMAVELYDVLRARSGKFRPGNEMFERQRSPDPARWQVRPGLSDHSNATSRAAFCSPSIQFPLSHRRLPRVGSDHDCKKAGLDTGAQPRACRKRYPQTLNVDNPIDAWLVTR